MAVTYLSNIISEKKYQNNVIIKIGAKYYGMTEPDSGLAISDIYKNAVTSLVLNPTEIDIRRVTTSISSFTFRLLDKNNIITTDIAGDAVSLLGKQVNIYLGRVNCNMDFSNYYELPITYIKKCEKQDNSYVFSTTEQTERIARPILDHQSALAVDILSGTTSFTMREDITSFPATGYLKLDDEFVSYTGKDLVNNRFTGVIRGEFNSIPIAHDSDTVCYLANSIQDNPLNIILKLLISNGGGGVYDTLADGLGISNSLIDIAEIESLRDELFIGVTFKLIYFNVKSTLKLIEDEILLPCGLRFKYSLNSKLSLAILDKAKFVEEENIIDHDTIIKDPKWSIDGNKIVNQIDINWDYEDGTGVYKKYDQYTNSTSVSSYGLQPKLTFNFKAVKSSLNGQLIVDDIANRLLDRLGFPTPEISITTQIDKSIQNVGDKAYLKSSRIPYYDGTLNFQSDLEILSRSINHTNGDVVFKLAFTSFTNIRSGYIAPSDINRLFLGQNKIVVTKGRGSYYRSGWNMLLWNESFGGYTLDSINTIDYIANDETLVLQEDGSYLLFESGDIFEDDNILTEDVIYFINNFTTDLSSGIFRIKFCDYDNAVDSQKRYCFISNNGANFTIDNKPTYKVTY